MGRGSRWVGASQVLRSPKERVQQPLSVTWALGAQKHWALQGCAVPLVACSVTHSWEVTVD